MSRRPGSRAPVRAFLPSPPPGASAPGGIGTVPGSAGALHREAPPAALDSPALPDCVRGVPPGAPPAVGRSVPNRGGLRGIAVPPELRRRIPGAGRAAPGAAEVVDQIRTTLRVAQRKLFASQRRLHLAAAALRTQLDQRR